MPDKIINNVVIDGQPGKFYAPNVLTGLEETEAISELKEELTLLQSDAIVSSDLLGGNINNLILESGSISLTTGEDTVNANRARSKGFLECEPNTKYTIDYGITDLSGYMWVIGYDANKNIITDSNVGGYTSVVGYINNSTGKGTFTTSATTKYMRWYNTANIPRNTAVKMYCLDNWKSDMDVARDIHSKDRFFLSAPYVPTITTLRTNKILVSFENATSLYIFRESGGQNYKRVDIPANTVYTLEANDVLIWDLNNNSISITGNTDSKSNNILLLNNYNGKPQQGEFLQYVPQYRPITKYNNTGCSVYHKVSDVTTTQGMTVVKDAIWGFNGSDDLHEHFYNIVVRDKNTFEQITTIRHNLGHCASADYNAKTDTVMVCNGNLTLDTPPEFYLIKNASSYNQSSEETLAYNDSTKVVKVDVHGFGDYSLVGCFGENEHIAYFAITNTNATTKFYKCLLGMGTVDYSDSGYGTFISGCADNEYNGTMLVLNSYNGINLDVFQGICFYNGDIYMLLDNSGRKEAYICKINLVNDSAYEVAETRMMIEEYNASGNKVYYEPEGLCVLDGMYWLFNLALTGQNRLVIVPINNRQGGKGTVGTAVTFPFPCNSTPNVQITSLTNKSIYISEVSNTGFTVNATDGTTGGVFTWECDIT